MEIVGKGCANLWTDVQKGRQREGAVQAKTWLDLADLGDAAILPRSFHYAGRRTENVRRKKPARSGQDDRLAGLAKKQIPRPPNASDLG
jgi:hypothetical protein